MKVLNLSFIQATIDSFKNKDSFARKSLLLTTGTALAQAIPILFSPILTRIFSPAEFGLLAIVSSITAIISVISTGRYESVILIAKTKKDAADIVSVALTISFLVSVLTLIVFLFFSNAIVGILKQPRLHYWIFVCPIMSFLISIYQVYNEWCIREAQFKHLSINKVVNSGSITLGNLLFGLSKISGGGLIWGELFGRFITALTCIINVARRDFDTFRNVTISRMRSLSIRYQNVPKFILPGQLLNTIAGQSSILLIAFFFGDQEVGYYSMTGLVLSVPASLISNTVRDVFRQRANLEYKVKNNCLNIYKKTIKTTAIFSVSIFAILFMILPGLFSFVFGSHWRIAGEYAQIITPTIMISFVAESVWGVFIITEKMKAILVWQIQYLIFTISSIGFGYYVFGSMKMVLICYVVARSLIYLSSIFMTYTFAKGISNHTTN